MTSLDHRYLSSSTSLAAASTRNWRAKASLADLSALIVEGRVMRDALVADLLELDGVEMTLRNLALENARPRAGSLPCAAPGEVDDGVRRAGGA